jgi:hypothetical protein
VTISRNYRSYLDLVNREKSFTTEGIITLAEGIDELFPELIHTFPMGDYKALLEKTDLMLKKASNPRLIGSLSKLKESLEQKISESEPKSPTTP